MRQHVDGSPNREWDSADDFAAIVERYSAGLISFLFGMIGDREQAEDLAQDTLIKAFEALQHRRAGQEFSSGWLFRIARNTALDALRRRRLIAWLPFAPEHERLLPARDDFAGQLADRELIQSILSQLPARYREVLLLRAVVDLSNTEIATALGMSPGSVNTLLFRARERFRQVHDQVTAADLPGPGVVQMALERPGSE